MKHIPLNIIISRTDSIGDVMLTLPMAAALKQIFPGVNIGFMGRAYTKPVITACKYVDEFIDREAFLTTQVLVCGHRPDAIIHVFPDARIAFRALQLNIRLRIGTTNRVYHWVTCNRLVKLSRKNSPLHEAQLNLKLLEPFGYMQEPSLQQLGQLFGLEKLEPLPDHFSLMLHPVKYNLILHPVSQGSAREWGLDNFNELINLLDKNRYKIFISGTAKERILLNPLFDKTGHQVTDITGLMTLYEFISFIAQANGLIANSTGPLHIAAALGKDALGIYPPMRPIHPGRWAPLGPKAGVFVLDKFCNECRHSPTGCTCIMDIQPSVLAAALEAVNKKQ